MGIQSPGVGDGGGPKHTHHSQLLRGVGLPQADVHLVRAAQDVLVVGRPADADDVLHALGVVHLPAERGRRVKTIL